MAVLLGCSQATQLKRKRAVSANMKSPQSRASLVLLLLAGAIPTAYARKYGRIFDHSFEICRI